MEEQYIQSAKKLFVYYKMLGERAIDQLEHEQIFFTENPETTNSIAVIIKHLHGNMLSRWTDFLTTDGEKSWRDREGEFEDTFHNYEEVIRLWHEGWKCLLDALDGLKPEQLNNIIYIRNEGHTVLEAINRQLAHYPMHVGQIIFFAKQLKKGNWESLSIPKGKSATYNSEKFAKEKVVKNFTDEDLKRLK
jgi:hypothetical protein